MATEAGRIPSGHRRAHLVTLALYAFGARGYRGTSLASIAKEAGISEPGLLHHFGSKVELLKRVLAEHEQVSREELLDVMDRRSLAEAAQDLARHYEAEPAWIRLWIALAAESIDAEHPTHSWFVERYRDARARVADWVLREQRAGRITTAVEADVLARLGLAVFDGVELQFLLDPDDADLVTPLRAFFALLKPEH